MMLPRPVSHKRGHLVVHHPVPEQDRQRARLGRLAERQHPVRWCGIADLHPLMYLRRVYSLRPQPLAEIDEWLGRYLALWEQRLDALHTEIARGKHERRSTR
jgi:hypothetical protein